MWDLDDITKILDGMLSILKGINKLKGLFSKGTKPVKSTETTIKNE